VVEPIFKGEWMMATQKVRVVFPKNVYAFLALVKRVIEKHRTEGGNSPLSILLEKWEAIEAKQERCVHVQQRAEALRREVEQLMEEKRQLMDELMKFMRAARDILLGIHSESPRNLGEWGFEVNNAVSKAAKKDANLPTETS